MRATCDIDSLGEQVQTNAELLQEISSVVIREILKLPGQTQLKLGPLRTLDFSSIFSIDWHLGNKRQGVFIKIPTVALRKRQVGLISPADRRFAAEEYGSLVRLSRVWNGAEFGVCFVKPLEFLAGYNAIITQRAYGREVFALWRRQDLLYRMRGPVADELMRDCLNRLGRALANYHQVCGQDELFEVEPTGRKIQGYLARLKELNVEQTILSQVNKALEGLRGRVASTHLTDTIKGLDIRNMLINSEGRLFLLDPGKIKRDYKEADLARFLVTCRILYWGSPWLFLRLTPRGAYGESFLQGYYAGAGAGDWVLTILTIKELLKHWLMAYVALELHRWSRALKAVMKKTYIDPFYQEQIREELRKLAEGNSH